MSERTIDVLVLAELNPDLVLSGPDVTPRFGQVETLVDSSTLTLGSSGAIFAAGCARLGLRTTVSGLIGPDTFGDYVKTQLRRHGVSDQGVVVDAGVSTGLTVILNRGEDRAILTHPGAMADMTVERIDAALLASARHIHVTSYFLQRSLQPGLPKLLREARRRGTTTSVDTNWDPAERWADGIDDVLEAVDTVLPNEAEAMALARAEGSSLAQAARKLNEVVPTVIIKRGAHGVYAVSDGVTYEVPALTTTVRDTTGAGDSFDAGYIYGQLSGLTMTERLRAATICGAHSTRGIGGVATQASERELLDGLEGWPA